MDGPTLCEAVRRDPLLNSCQLLLMTGQDQPAQIAEGLARGADDFLSKSASKQEITARVLAGLRTSRLLRELETTGNQLESSLKLLQRKQEETEADLQCCRRIHPLAVSPTRKPRPRNRAGVGVSAVFVVGRRSLWRDGDRCGQSRSLYDGCVGTRGLRRVALGLADDMSASGQHASIDRIVRSWEGLIRGQSAVSLERRWGVFHPVGGSASLADRQPVVRDCRPFRRPTQLGSAPVPMAYALIVSPWFRFVRAVCMRPPCYEACRPAVFVERRDLRGAVSKRGGLGPRPFPSGDRCREADVSFGDDQVQLFSSPRLATGATVFGRCGGPGA